VKTTRNVVSTELVCFS